MRKTCSGLCVLAGLLISPLALAASPATQPASPAASAAGSGQSDGKALEVMATAAFNRKEYALALPMLQKVANGLQSDPDRLGVILEQIRVCQRNIAKGNKGPAPGAVASAAPNSATVAAIVGQGDPNAGPPTAETRKPHVRPKDGEFLVADIKELGNFEYDAQNGGNIPEDVTKLSGCKIRTHGFMIPLDQAENISEFALVPSLFACCFGQPPQVQHTIVVHCPKGKAVSYSPDELTVEGNLKVDEKKDDGFIVSIFEIDASSVKVAEK